MGCHMYRTQYGEGAALTLATWRGGQAWGATCIGLNMERRQL